MNRYEYNVMFVAGKDAQEMGEALSAALEGAVKDGWEPINFMPIRYKPINTAKENTHLTGLSSFRFETVSQQVVMRKLS